MDKVNKVIKVYLIILVVALLITLICLGEKADAKLNEETLKEVEILRNKHYGLGTYLYIPDDSDMIWRHKPRKPEYFFIIEDVPDWYDSSDYFIDDRLKILINGEIYWIRLEKEGKQ